MKSAPVSIYALASCKGVPSTSPLRHPPDLITLKTGHYSLQYLLCCPPRTRMSDVQAFLRYTHQASFLPTGLLRIAPQLAQSYL